MAARPNETRRGEARALYQRGIGESHRGESRAQQTLASAMDRSLASSDASTAALAAAALLITGQSMHNYRRFRECSAALAGLRDGSLTFSDRDEELIAHTGWLCSMVMLSPRDPSIEGCVERVMRLLEVARDVNARYAAGRFVIYYADAREKRELAQRTFALLDPLAEHPELTPHRYGRWLIVWMRSTADAKDPALHRRACDEARRLAERHREPEVVASLAAAEFEQGVRLRDFGRVERALPTIEEASDPANVNDMARLAWLKGRHALAKHEGDAALFYARRTLAYAQDMELPPPMLGVRMALEAQARVAVGAYAGAREGFRRTSEIVAPMHADEMRDMLRMVDAYEAFELHRPDARELLQRAFAAPRARQYYDSFDTNPPFGAKMCAFALDHDVEVEFVRRLISLHRLAPPGGASETWPWPLSIVTLGGFELYRNDAPIAFQGKVQRKPIELLKAIIACGGQRVDKAQLADALWGDAESNAAAASLDMAISRLRKMLESPDAVRIEDGKIGLDPEHAWVDVWVFDRDVEALQRELRRSATIDDAEVLGLGQRLLSRYRGAFLENESPQRWLLAARDRWRSRFKRSLVDAGRHWEHRERWREAIELYERGIEVDTLAEDLYRKLMQCHLAQRQPAEAARVYRRCRDMLSIQLGIAPSAETEALFRSIYR